MREKEKCMAHKNFQNCEIILKMEYYLKITGADYNHNYSKD